MADWGIPLREIVAGSAVHSKQTVVVGPTVVELRLVETAEIDTPDTAVEVGPVTVMPLVVVPEGAMELEHVLLMRYCVTMGAR
jgi:hypothetical protein